MATLEHSQTDIMFLIKNSTERFAEHFYFSNQSLKGYVLGLLIHLVLHIGGNHIPLQLMIHDNVQSIPLLGVFLYLTAIKYFPKAELQNNKSCHRSKASPFP